MELRGSKRRRGKNSSSSQQVTVGSPTTARPQATRDEPEFVHGEVEPDRYIAWSEPPMSTLEEIFEHLAQKAVELGLEQVLLHLNGRPLRVATVCSGTESPLLALEMIQKGKLHLCFIL
jgi:hypothetical protein